MGILEKLAIVSLEIILIVLLIKSGPKSKAITSKYFVIIYEYVNIIFVFYVFYKLLVTQTYLEFAINGFNVTLLIVLAMQFIVVVAVDILRKREEILKTTFIKSKYKAALGLLFILSIVSKTTLISEIMSL